MLKSKTINGLSNMVSKRMPSNNVSFGDFHKLELEGSQKILTPGEYFIKENTTKMNRQKVIKYFYDKLLRI